METNDALEQLRTSRAQHRRVLGLFGCLLLGAAWFSLTAAEPAPAPAPAATRVGELRVEFLKNPLGIAVAEPALSWTLLDGRRGAVQRAYRVLVASSEELLARDEGDLWDSGELASDQSHLVRYQGRALVSRERCFWKVQVKVADHDGKETAPVWSKPAWWEMGLLKSADWQGSWIQSPVCKPIDNEITQLWIRQALIPQPVTTGKGKDDSNAAEAMRAEGERLMQAVLPVPVFRKTFNVEGAIKRARLYVSGLGYAETFVNGAAVTDNVFEPSVNFYEKRAGYVTHDITAALRSGSNVVTAIVGGGWWHEPLVWSNPETVMGQPSLRAQIEVELTDGKKIIVPTDASWTTAIGPILKSSYYAGEAYDARRAPGWKSGADDGLAWVASTEIKSPVPVLEAQLCEPERVIRRLKPVAVTQPRPGIWVYDMGQMCMGTVELNVKAAAGTTLVLRTAEWTWTPSQQGPEFAKVVSRLHYDEGDNSAWTEGMIIGKARGGTYFSWNFKPRIHLGVPTLVYVARGDEKGEVWHPRFTLHPFRYVEVQGLKEEPTLDLLTGLMITNDEEVIGEFTADHQRFNDIWEASMNSTRFTTHGMSWDNAVERLQSQVYNAWSAPFASYVLSYPNLWRKIMEDLRHCSLLTPESDQAFGTAIYGSRGGAAAPRMAVTQSTIVELPMAYYDRYGDKRELEKQYPYMKAWCEAFFPNRDGKIVDGATMGAWNDHFYKEAAGDSNWTPEWDQRAMMSMMLYKFSRETADVARILGKTDDAASLEKMAESIREEVNRTWYDADNKTYGAAKNKKDDSIDSSKGWHGLMAMAIAHGIAPKNDVPKLVSNCIEDMKAHYHSHYAAGHITHQLLYDVYSDNGLVETCYDMMNSTGFPSFAWMLQSGNRTIPEGPTLPSQLPSKSSAYQNECQEPARWFTQMLCGISPDRAQPGFKHFFLRPRIPSKLPAASLTTTTPYGKVESSWKQNDGKVTWTVRIPANSSATAWIPTSSLDNIRESGYPLKSVKACEVKGAGKDGIECRLGSGVYQFDFPSPANEPSRLSELK